jgi:hypothetical protein
LYGRCVASSSSGRRSGAGTFPRMSLHGSVARLEPRGSSRPIAVFNAKMRNPCHRQHRA